MHENGPAGMMARNEGLRLEASRIQGEGQGREIAAGGIQGSGQASQGKAGGIHGRDVKIEAMTREARK